MNEVYIKGEDSQKQLTALKALVDDIIAHALISSSLSHSLFTALRASGISMALSRVIS